MFDPLPPDADHVEVGDPADLQLEAELGQAAGVVDLTSQDVPLLLTLDTLVHNSQLVSKIS